MSTPTPEASPRPWRAYPPDPSVTRWHIETEGRRFVGSTLTAEDAALIVAAVNLHADFVALAEKVAAHFEDTDAPLGQEARALLNATTEGA